MTNRQPRLFWVRTLCCVGGDRSVNSESIEKSLNQKLAARPSLALVFKKCQSVEYSLRVSIKILYMTEGRCSSIEKYTYVQDVQMQGFWQRNCLLPPRPYPQPGLEEMLYNLECKAVSWRLNVLKLKQRSQILEQRRILKGGVTYAD